MANAITVGHRDAGQTLAAFVRSKYAEFTTPGSACSWNQAKGLCESGRVWVDGERGLDPAARLRQGASIEVRIHAEKLRRGVLPQTHIAYVDRDVVVVRKPAGMMSVPFEETDKDTLVDQTRAALRKMAKARADKTKGQTLYDPPLGVVHRLDKDTTGLLVFARTLEAKKHLEQQFRVHSVERRYQAIVHGEARDMTCSSYLIADRGDGLRGSWGVFRKPRSHQPPDDARASTTHVRVLEKLKAATLIECQLETGRQHQIRIHLSEAGHPLVGEEVYIRDYRDTGKTLIKAPRIMLHAFELGFVHPRTHKPVHFLEPLPADFSQVLARLRA